MTLLSRGGGGPGHRFALAGVVIVEDGARFVQVFIILTRLIVLDMVG